MAAFFRQTVDGKSLPKLQWNHTDVDRGLQLTVQSDTSPELVRLWTARAQSQDFRRAIWRPRRLTPKDDGTFVANVPKPDRGHVALFGEAVYKTGPLQYSLSTQIRRE